MAVRFKDGKYIIDYYPRGRKGPRKVFSLPIGTTESEAKKIEHEMRGRRKRALIVNPSANISHHVKAYLADCDLHQSPDTAEDKRSCFKLHLLPYFGHLSIPELVPAHITAYKQHAKTKTYNRSKQPEGAKPLSNKTITKGLSYFSAFLKWAAEELNVVPLQTLRFKKLPSVRPVPIVLSFEEVLQFIKSADRVCPQTWICRNRQCPHRLPYNTMFKTFFYLGPRNRAVRRMRWEDINWEIPAIKTIEKGNKVKWHPLPDDLLSELKALHAVSRSEYIYPSPRDFKKPVNNILKAVARAKKAAGITKRVYPHLLRHSIGTHMVDADIDLRQIQEFLGHAQISTTLWYTQVSIEKKRQALEKAGIKTTKNVVICSESE